jgi:mannose-6-phosphate isomerase-like protein (cupin superfamily)
MLISNNSNNMEVVIKPWGKEEWLELNDKYCYKKIFFKAGNQCSLQYHVTKKETIHVVSGEGFLFIEPDVDIDSTNLETFSVQLEDRVATICKLSVSAGFTITINPFRIHRLQAVTDLTTLEVSTPEVDDCIRVLDDTNRPNGRINEEHGK